MSFLKSLYRHFSGHGETQEKERSLNRERFDELAPLLSDGQRFQCKWEERWLIEEDLMQNTAFDAHYVYHTSWAARILARLNPDRHIDIGSCLRFISLVSAFIPMTSYDYRPPVLTLGNLSVGHADIVNLAFPDASVSSLSCMHVVEHVGLGRYGDPFDPRGDLKAMSELRRVLAPEGHLLFVVPVGRTAKIMYNAHRIYTFDQVLAAFDGFTLVEFSFVEDAGTFLENVDPAMTTKSTYGCGCFHFVNAVPC